MKSNILTLAIILFFSINFSFADDWVDNFKIEEEAYIDDIPFDTKAIFDKIQKSKESCYKDILSLEEEDYIDDIPFDTKKIFNKYFQCKVYANICK